MLTTNDLIQHTGLNTPSWVILLEEAERYGYDDEKVRNIAWGFKIGWFWTGNDSLDECKPINAESVEYTL